MAEIPKPAKRALFAKPAWTKPTSDAKAVEEGDIFGRGSHLIEDIMADKERVKREKLARKQRRESEGTDGRKKRKSSDMEDEDGSWVVVKRPASQEHAGAERRLSASNRGDVAGGGSNRPDTAASNSISPEKAASTCMSTQPISRDRYITKPTKHPPPQSAVVDLLDSDDDDEAHLYSVSPAKTATNGTTKASVPRSESGQRPAQHDSDEELDPFLRELAAKARARRREAEAAKIASPVRPNPSIQRSSTQPLSAANSFEFNAPNSTATDTDGPVIQILITSRINNARPLLVKRRLKQRLHEVRDAWCKREGLPSDESASIFLTFRGRRLYDSTTCKSLGIAVDEDGEIIMRSGKSRGADGLCEGKIHMEVCNPEAFEEMKREAAQKLKAKVPEEEPLPTQEKKVEEKLVKLVLKAKGHEDFKLRAKPTSTFEEIANGFRRKRVVLADQQVFLTWDGERLSPTAKLEDTEIADMDSIDVHIK
ncbi:hypothetical protein W97_05908 [Coniosporium apollinis CBS 100218]|uniref:Ubiquitin-like domain-containing protein n=1 Tax=Coniosporium apollinis (strain CBS 100218) TaxID=1168221 RepID=R7YXP2_CONA1|nr:uncharacterized protein W97_05908 [Coniosporium apollinis CBS 100218]EON66662.1 hypothetical protein W97_05908 [Coniosporium apollinis CBS 100218]